MLASLYTIKNTEGKELLQTFLHTGAVLRWNSLLLQKRRGVKRKSVSLFHRHCVFQKGLEMNSGKFVLRSQTKEDGRYIDIKESL